MILYSTRFYWIYLCVHLSSQIIHGVLICVSALRNY